MALTSVKLNKLNFITKYCKLFSSRQNKTVVPGYAELSTNIKCMKHSNLPLITKRNSGSCGRCEPPRKKKQDHCRDTTKKCGPECPPLEPLKKPSCPIPTRPPQPERCKAKTEIRKKKACHGPCPKRTPDNCDDKPCNL